MADLKSFKIEDGIVKDPRVMQHHIAKIDHGPLGAIRAIVVHQTASDHLGGTFASWETDEREAGAHFIIDKNGTIYQTIPINELAWHVAPIKSRCYEEHTCKPDEAKAAALAYKQGNKAVGRHEMQKSYPARFPGNSDSVGIEIVSAYRTETDDFVTPTPEQQASLKWLVSNLLDALSLVTTDVYRHGAIGFKKASEARDAAW